jgi:hypothetical protein
VFVGLNEYNITVGKHCLKKDSDNNMQGYNHEDKTKPDPVRLYKALYTILSARYGVRITLKSVKKIDEETNEEITIYQDSDEC